LNSAVKDAGVSICLLSGTRMNFFAGALHMLEHAPIGSASTR
jgi:hypothetical protein